MPADLGQAYELRLPADSRDIAYSKLEGLQGDTLFAHFTAGTDTWRPLLTDMRIPSFALSTESQFSNAHPKAAGWRRESLPVGEGSVMGCTEASDLPIDATTCCLHVSAPQYGGVIVHGAAGRN